MSDKLNEQFFETKNKHKQSFNWKKSLIFWGTILLISLSLFVAKTLIADKKAKDSVKERTQNFLSKGLITSKDTTVSFPLIGTQIIVLKDCQFKFENSGAVVVKLDSTGLAYVTKRIIYEAGYSSLIDQLKNSYVSKYIFSDCSTDSTSFETVQVCYFEGDDGFKGKVKAIKRGGLLYSIFIMSRKEYWDHLANETGQVEQSFKIIE